MGLERDLYEFWLARRGQTGGTGWFSPASRDAVLADPESVSIASRLSPVHGDASPGVMLLVLRAMDVMASEVEPRIVDAEFVATLRIPRFPAGHSTAKAATHSTGFRPPAGAERRG